MVAAELFAEGPAGRFDMARVVRRTFGVLKRNLLTFAGLALVLQAIPQAAVNWGVPHYSAGIESYPTRLLISLVAWFISLVGSLLLQAAIVHGTVADLNEKRATLGAALSTSVRFFLPLLGLALLMTVAYTAGLIALVVPGIMLIVMWSVAAPALVVERKGVFAAFQRSRKLTKGSRWALFGLGVVYMIVVYAIFFALAGVKAVVLTAANGVTPVQAVISAVLTAFTSMTGSVAAAAIYYELRSVKEGAGVGALASVFD